jgi:amicyanin
MMGGMMGGLMGGFGGAGNSEQDWSMPCVERWSDNGDATQSDYANVIIGNYNFHPQNLTVKVGTTVTWINMDFVGHNVEAGTHDEDGHNHDDEALESPILGHMESFSYTFTELGEYVYHCDPHPYMEGRIIVVE